MNLNLEEYVDDIYSGRIYDKNNNSPLVAFNNYFHKYFNPDINGYFLTFFIPPPFEGISESSNIDRNYLRDLRTILLFAAFDITPPQRMIESERTNTRSGGVPYATEASPTNQCTISYIDNHDLDIYNFHNNWYNYVFDLLEGFIEPPIKYLDYNSEIYGGLDYAASIFIVKYDTDMKTIKYVGKITGVYPQSLPSKELLGQRTTNELTMLPFTYFSSYYDETLNKNHPIWKELEEDVIPQLRS